MTGGEILSLRLRLTANPPPSSEGGKTLPKGEGKKCLHRILCRLFLCLSLKAFLAFGTGDHNFALAPGHAHRLTAFGAVKIPMLPVLDPIQQHQKPPIFPIPLVGVPGKGTKNRPNHQCIRSCGQRQIHHRKRYKNGNDTQHQAATQNPHIQFVRAVAAHHKALKRLFDTIHQRKSPS